MQKDPPVVQQIEEKTEASLKIYKEDQAPLTPVMGKLLPKPETTPALERVSSAKRKARKLGFGQNPSEKKAKATDAQYLEMVSFFKKLTAENMAKNMRRSFDMENHAQSEEEKNSAIEEEKVQRQSVAEPVRIEKDLAESPSMRRQNNSVEIQKREFFRITGEDEANHIVTIVMLFTNQNQQPVQLKFNYNLLKDTPLEVAKEMVKALKLEESDINKIEELIKTELSIFYNYQTPKKYAKEPKEKLY